MAAMKEIWIESYDYFKAGNRFAGSCGALGFKIIPDKEPPQLRVMIWEGPNCCEKSEIREQREFESSSEGLQQAVDWINAEAKACWERQEE